MCLLALNNRQNILWSALLKFLNGAQAQEEVLARSSDLYYSLIQCPDFYGGGTCGPAGAQATRAAADEDAASDSTDGGEAWARAPASGKDTRGWKKQKHKAAHAGGGDSGGGKFYTDGIVYSPQVTFFRDCAGTLLPRAQLYRADVLSCQVAHFAVKSTS